MYKWEVIKGGSNKFGEVPIAYLSYRLDVLELKEKYFKSNPDGFNAYLKWVESYKDYGGVRIY
jgi:hypothetical protein